MSQLEAVKGLLLAENAARFSGNDSPLDSDDTLIATVHLMCDGLRILQGGELHDHMLETHPNRAALSVEETETWFERTKNPVLEKPGMAVEQDEQDHGKNGISKRSRGWTRMKHQGQGKAPRKAA